MKSETHDRWIRYRCDGPLCNPDISNIKKWMITPDTAFCQHRIPTNNWMRDKTTIDPGRKPDIIDYGWRRVIINEKVCHICPKCLKEFQERLARKLYEFIRVYASHDLPTIQKIAEICSSPYLYEDLSKDDYKE